MWPSVKEVSYLEHIIGGGCIRPDPKKLQVIAEYPRQKKLPEVVVWTTQCEDAFQTLKRTLMTKPVLAVMDPTRKFILQTDASEKGLGAVLSQMFDDQDKPIAYASRKLQPREKNYSTTEKECLAVVWALKTFHTYLYGQRFKIQSDH